MYRRRRRPNAEIHFSFDSFLDLVANVIGIIIKLILIAWVGGRSYNAAMTWGQSDAAAVAELPAPQVTDDPLHAELARMRAALREAQAKLQGYLGQTDGKQQQAEQIQSLIAQLASRRQQLEAETGRIGAQLSQHGSVEKEAAISLEELRRRSQKLLDEVKQVQAQPPPKKALRYHAPVSREVYADELHFECKAGRVTYIDLPALLHEVNLNKESVAKELRGQWSVTHVAGPAGPFRLRYVYARAKSGLETMGRGRPDSDGGFSYGLSEWTVEPVVAQRGETSAAALAAGSEFRQLVDKLDSRLAVVTFWVYPDSFELFRQLRDHLYERGIEVAGRPLDEDVPIKASRHGTASRGQ